MIKILLTTSFLLASRCAMTQTVEEKKVEENITAKTVQKQLDSVNKSLTVLLNKPKAKSKINKPGPQIIYRTIYRDTCISHDSFVVETPDSIPPLDTVYLIDPVKRGTFFQRFFNVFRRKKIDYNAREEFKKAGWNKKDSL